MTERLLVLIWQHADVSDVDGLVETYEHVSKDMAGTPGLLGNQLVQSSIDSDTYAVFAEWSDMRSFQDWYKASAHQTTEPMRRYRDPDRPGPRFDIFRVIAEH